jgi:membrane-associated phospholipid phosphatase
MNNFLMFAIYSSAHITPWLDTVIWFFAEPFIYIMTFIISVYYVLDRTDLHRKITREFIVEKLKLFSHVFLAGSIAWVVGNGLKYVFHTSRPFVIFSNIHPLFTEAGYAFPSGHSTVAAALAFLMFFKYKRFGAICLIGALFVGLARVAAGVHFPLDIAGGYTLGFLVAFLAKTL